jgi:hypothetical protein
VRAVIAESRVFASWRDYHEALIRAIAPLTPEQLQQRPLPTLRTPGEITAHIVYGRALHLTHSIGSAAAAVHPWLSWDGSTAGPQTATAIVDGLEATWKLLAETLQRGAPTDPVTDDDDTTLLQTIWGLLDHDLPHAGELSLLLGAQGLPWVEI